MWEGSARIYAPGDLDQEWNTSCAVRVGRELVDPPHRRTRGREYVENPRDNDGSHAPGRDEMIPCHHGAIQRRGQPNRMNA